MRVTLARLLLTAVAAARRLAVDAPNDTSATANADDTGDGDGDGVGGGDENVDVDDAVSNRYFAWVDAYPAQIALLAMQVTWTTAVERALNAGTKSGGGGGSDDSAVKVAAALARTLRGVEIALQRLAARILQTGLVADARKKYEHLITELVHQRDTVRSATTSDYTISCCALYVVQR
jgi:hypothetical protein